MPSDKSTVDTSGTHGRAVMDRLRHQYGPAYAAALAEAHEQYRWVIKYGQLDHDPFCSATTEVELRHAHYLDGAIRACAAILRAEPHKFEQDAAPTLVQVHLMELVDAMRRGLNRHGLTPPEIRARVEQGERVVILVTDYSDPTYSRKVPRLVGAALPSDVPDDKGGMTRGRWSLYFDGPYRHPLILITGETARFTPTDETPTPQPPVTAVSPPTPAPRRSLVSPQERELINEAHQAGREDGWRHAAYVDAYGGDVTTPPEVPERFASVASWYVSGWTDGIEGFESSEDGADHAEYADGETAGGRTSHES